MPLAYYSRSATAEFWSEHWGRHSVEELLRIARHSPLTELIARHLRSGGPVLEAGCGVGQYVLLLREHGHAAVGADWSFEAVQQGSRAGAPLAVMDLRALAIRDRSVANYLSLGVVEHDPAGPDAIVAEAARVVTPGGMLLLSVPYWNGVRRLLAPFLVRQNRRVRGAGGKFYQFAFSRREVRGFLEAHGFSVRAFHPYDPARVLRKAVRAFALGAFGAVAARAGTSWGFSGEADPPAASRRPATHVRGAVRRLLYSGSALRLFAHMILAVAVKR